MRILFIQDSCKKLTLGSDFTLFHFKCVGVWSVCMSAPSVHRDQKRADPLELALQMVVSCHMGIKHVSSGKAANALKH